MSIYVPSNTSKVRTYLVDQIVEKKGAKSEADAIASASEIDQIEKDTKKLIQSIKENAKMSQLMALKANYEKILNTLVTVLTSYKVTHWNADADAISTMKDDYTALSEKMSKNETDYTDSVAKTKASSVETLTAYTEVCKKINPQYAENADSVWKTLMAKAENAFDQMKAAQQAAANAAKIKKIKSKRLSKALATKTFKLDLTLKWDNDKIMQELAQIPMKIEDKIQEIRDLLDTLLGKTVAPVFNPDKPEFDIDQIIAKMNAFVEPLMAALNPLESVGGSVPVLGDLAGIFSMMSSAGKPSKMTKEEIIKKIKEMLGGFKVEIPTNILQSAGAIKDDIMLLCMIFPMILFNVVFAMIDAIVGMFDQIRGVIGVPPIPFPLSLLPQAIKVPNLAWQFITNGGGLIYSAVAGIIKDKLTEAMLMTIPDPDIDLDKLKGLDPEVEVTDVEEVEEVEESEADKASTKSKPDAKKVDYTDVNNEILKILKPYGYDLMDLTRVLKSYKKIYDGSNGKINVYTGNSVPSSQITRSKGTPDDYRQKLIEDYTTRLPPRTVTKDNMVFDEVNKTKSVVGAMLYENEKEIAQQVEPNEEIVITQTIVP